MTKEEWVELFQAMNGRDPLPKEFLDAKEAGEFQELPSLTELGEEVAQVQDKPSKESWVELFQALHGRDPLPKEFLEAKGGNLPFLSLVRRVNPRQVMRMS